MIKYGSDWSISRFSFVNKNVKCLIWKSKKKNSSEQNASPFPTTAVATVDDPLKGVLSSHKIKKMGQRNACIQIFMSTA